MKTLISALICLLSAIPCQAIIITVDDNGIADFNSIQLAIDSASDGDIIIVQPGLYDESINFLGKNITLTSTNPANPIVVARTTINGGVSFNGTEDPNCSLTGFNINQIIYGSFSNHTHATISHCVLQGNSVYGGTVISFCDGTISNCVIADNIASEDSLVIGPAIDYCHGLFKNCTIVNNYCANGITVQWNGGQITIENCIIYGNEGYQIFAPIEATANIQYSNIQGGLSGIFEADNVNWGPGNIDTDPCFVREGYWDFNEPRIFFEGDYHLKSEGWRWDSLRQRWDYDDVTSRCIDAGNPGSPLADELMSVPDDPCNIWGENIRINMGAYGGTTEASMPPYDWTLLADITNDGTVDFVDFAHSADIFGDQGGELPGDFDRDGDVDLADLDWLTNDWLLQTIWFEP